MTVLAFNKHHAIDGIGHSRKCLSQVSDVDRLQEEWADFILKQFETEDDAAKAFGVSVRTIQNWQKQDVLPRGPHVYRAIRKFGFMPNG